MDNVVSIFERYQSVRHRLPKANFPANALRVNSLMDVLDEVDAALDEANVDRFVGVLRDFLSSTQFIVVTHSKKTMATATTLYGVTMEESGVSKRVAVQFESNSSSVKPKAA